MVAPRRRVVDAPQDHYKVLGIPPTATPDEVKTAFRNHAREYHPDKNKEEGAEDRFKELITSYEVLASPRRRQEYDLKRGCWGGGLVGRTPTSRGSRTAAAGVSPDIAAAYGVGGQAFDRAFSHDCFEEMRQARAARLERMQRNRDPKFYPHLNKTYDNGASGRGGGGGTAPAAHSSSTHGPAGASANGGAPSTPTHPSGTASKPTPSSGYATAASRTASASAGPDGARAGGPTFIPSQTSFAGAKDRASWHRNLHPTAGGHEGSSAAAPPPVSRSSRSGVASPPVPPAKTKTAEPSTPIGKPAAATRSSSLREPGHGVGGSGLRDRSDSAYTRGSARVRVSKSCVSSPVDVPRRPATPTRSASSSQKAVRNLFAGEEEAEAPASTPVRSQTQSSPVRVRTPNGGTTPAAAAVGGASLRRGESMREPKASSFASGARGMRRTSASEATAADTAASTTTASTRGSALKKDAKAVRGSTRTRSHTTDTHADPAASLQTRRVPVSRRTSVGPLNGDAAAKGTGVNASGHSAHDASFTSSTPPVEDTAPPVAKGASGKTRPQSPVRVGVPLKARARSRSCADAMQRSLSSTAPLAFGVRPPSPSRKGGGGGGKSGFGRPGSPVQRRPDPVAADGTRASSASVQAPSRNRPPSPVRVGKAAAAARSAAAAAHAPPAPTANGGGKEQPTKVAAAAEESSTSGPGAAATTAGSGAAGDRTEKGERGDKGEKDKDKPAADPWEKWLADQAGRSHIGGERRGRDHASSFAKTMPASSASGSVHVDKGTAKAERAANKARRAAAQRAARNISVSPQRVGGEHGTSAVRTKTVSFLTSQPTMMANLKTQKHRPPDSSWRSFSNLTLPPTYI